MRAATWFSVLTRSKRHHLEHGKITQKQAFLMKKQSMMFKTRSFKDKLLCDDSFLWFNDTAAEG